MTPLALDLNLTLKQHAFEQQLLAIRASIFVVGYVHRGDLSHSCIVSVSFASMVSKQEKSVHLRAIFYLIHTYSLYVKRAR